MVVFQSGDFLLHSKKRSEFKIDCDYLSDEDIATLALMGSKVIGPFTRAIGVPKGGLRFAEAINNFGDLRAKHILIVDDVWTSGLAVWNFIKEHDLAPEKLKILTIFSRGYMFPGNKNIKAIFSMPQHPGEEKVWL